MDEKLTFEGALQKLEKLVDDVQKKMKRAAAELNFEVAAELRDKLIELKKHLLELEKNDE